MFGYGEQPYATTSYIANLGEKFGKAQFEALITTDKFLKSQFEGLITRDKLLKAQFEGFITVDDFLKSQFEGFITTDDFLKTQFVGFITTDKFLNAQFEGFITVDDFKKAQFEGFITVDDFLNAEFESVRQVRLKTQFESVRQERLPLEFESVRQVRLKSQFKVVLYNTTQLRFMYEYPSRGTSGTNWTASSTATSASNGFTVNNLNTDIVEQVWRSANTNVTTLDCDTEEPSGIFMDTFAIIEHNFTLGAEVILIGSNDANFSTTPFYQPLTITNKNIFHIEENLPQDRYRYWRIQITDTSNPDGYLQAGAVVFGSSVVFSENENFTDEVEFGIKQFADSIPTEGFTNISNDRGQKKYLNINFKNLVDKGRNVAQLRKLFEEASTLLKVLWIPTPEDPTKFAVFAKMSEIPREKHKFMGESYLSLNIRTDESN